MRCTLAALAAIVMVLLAGAPRRVPAQQWNSDRALVLAREATERRARQLADAGLVDYRATAHGYLTFLAQVGEGFREPPRIVKADELALEVYWRTPDLSKQRIVGLRDTLLLPTDINYHRDHLGIIQNNFPSIIRLGDGDEVVDVPHPLSADGLTAYDFAVGDSLGIAIPGRTITVDVIRVRPRDDTKPRVVGAVFVERETAQVVRMAFSFTRAAFRDQGLEDISVVLESSLVEGRFWLPTRQEIEIRRTGTWMEYPVRGIIRGRWEICCHAVNTGLPVSLFRGPEIVVAGGRDQLRAALAGKGRILDSLPSDVRAATDEDVRRVQSEARRLVRQQALAKRGGAAVAARGLSDIVRVNRVEGLAAGGAIARRWGGGMVTSIGGRYGFADDRLKGRLALAHRRASGSAVELFAVDDFRDAGDEPEVSLARNSIGAQEFGSDYSDPYGVRALGARLTWAGEAGTVLSLEGTVERQRPLTVAARPASGRYEPTIPAQPRRGPRVSALAERATGPGWLGVEWRGNAEFRWSSMRADGVDGGATIARVAAARTTTLRIAASLHAARPLGSNRLVSHSTIASAFGGRVPVQELAYLGGPTSGPGYDYHAFAARTGLTQRIEGRRSVPFVPIRLGRFGRVPGEAIVAPFAHAIYVDQARAAPAARAGVYPSIGLGLLAPFDLVRFDVARGLRSGRWTFSVDLSRDFWSVL